MDGDPGFFIIANSLDHCLLGSVVVYPGVMSLGFIPANYFDLCKNGHSIHFSGQVGIGIE